MDSISRISLNQKKLTTVDPEITKIFQSKINPNLTQEQIAAIIEPLQSKPNLIVGQIINLSYQENSNNLVEIEIESLTNLFTLSVDFDASSESESIRVNNLNDYQTRLQEAFNYKHSVEIYIENSKIALLGITLDIKMMLRIGRLPKRMHIFS